MLKKSSKRPKTSKPIILNKLKIENHNNSKELTNKDFYKYKYKLKFNNHLKKNKSTENMTKSSSNLLNLSNKLVNNIYTSFNSTNTESNTNKLNNTNYTKKNETSNQYSQYHYSFYFKPTFRPKTFRTKKESKYKKIAKFISLK